MSLKSTLSGFIDAPTATRAQSLCGQGRLVEAFQSIWMALAADSYAWGQSTPEEFRRLMEEKPNPAWVQFRERLPVFPGHDEEARQVLEDGYVERGRALMRRVKDLEAAKPRQLPSYDTVGFDGFLRIASRDDQRRCEIGQAKVRLVEKMDDLLVEQAQAGFLPQARQTLDRLVSLANRISVDDCAQLAWIHGRKDWASIYRKPGEVAAERREEARAAARRAAAHLAEVERLFVRQPEPQGNIVVCSLKNWVENGQAREGLRLMQALDWSAKQILFILGEVIQQAGTTQAEARNRALQVMVGYAFSGRKDKDNLITVLRRVGYSSGDLAGLETWAITETQRRAEKKR